MISVALDKLFEDHLVVIIILEYWFLLCILYKNQHGETQMQQGLSNILSLDSPKFPSIGDLN